MLRDVRHVDWQRAALTIDKITVEAAAHRVMRHPAVSAKHFLVSIGDRTVGGLCARDPFVGPWQFFFFQAEDGIRDLYVTGVQTCALPILHRYDKLTGEVRNVAPRGTYRYLRTAPLLFSEVDPQVLFLGAQMVLKTTDGGGS